MFDTDAGFQGFNLFVYCGNNPINRIDISGSDSEKVEDVDLDDDEVQERGGGGGGTHGGLGSGGSQSTGVTSGKIEIHHIVEQCQAQKSGFSQDQIQANSNKIPMDYSDHRKISGYYSSKKPFSEGLRVRDWLAGQSFAEQMAFGWKILEELFGGKYGQDHGF